MLMNHSLVKLILREHLSRQSLSELVGGFLVGPLMERQLEAVGDIPNRAQAEEIMQRSLKVLYYRDKSTYNNWSIGFAEKNNSVVNEPKKLETNWRIADQISGYE